MKHSKSDGKEREMDKKCCFVSTDNGNRVVGLVGAENTALCM